MHKLILKHVESSNPLVLQQWRFRSGRSTLLALLDVTHTSKEVCTVFLIYAKRLILVSSRKVSYNPQELTAVLLLCMLTTCSSIE